MNLEQLRKLLAEAAERMKNLNDSLVDKDGNLRDMNDVEKEEWNKLKARTAQIEEMIDRAEEALKAEKRARDLDEPINEPPRIQVTREDKHNDNGEYRGYRPMGEGGLGHFLRDVARAARGGEMSTELRGLSDATKHMRTALGANLTVGSEGGFLPQSDHAVELQNQALAANDIAQDCRVIRTERSMIELKLLDETSRASGSRFGGMQVYRRKEAEAVQATQPKFRTEDLKVESIEGIMYATDEELEDVPYLESLISEFYPQEFGWKIGDEVIGGTGAGENVGVINSPAKIVVPKESGQSADTVVYLNTDKMVDRMPISSRPTAKWYAHLDVRRQLRNAVFTPGSNTDFCPFVPGGTMLGQQSDSLHGHPIKYIEQARALGDVGDFMFLDLKQYILVIRTGVKASQSIHVQFLTSQKTFKFTQRVIGQPLPNSPITDAFGSTTRSPIVLLAERA